MKNKIISFIIARGKEPSSYRGLALFLSAVGIVINPTLLPQIIVVGTSLAGLIGMMFPDKVSSLDAPK